MKTKNFPQKRQERRQRAFDQLQKKWGNVDDIHLHALPFAVKRDLLTLIRKLSLGNLRDMRTKKNR